MKPLPPKLQQCVESLCGDGCQAVYRHIEHLESGGSLPQTEQLEYAEQQQVLAELKSIMAVYGSSCRIQLEIAGPVDTGIAEHKKVRIK